jgi:hypothetical protein
MLSEMENVHVLREGEGLRRFRDTYALAAPYGGNT